MNKFVLVAFFFAVAGEALADLGLPKMLAYSPELCAIAASVAVIAMASRNGLPELRPSYAIVMVLLGLGILFSLIANQVQPGTVIIGARIYFRAIPFFFLALLAPPDHSALRWQFSAFIVFGVIQLPLAVYQRIATMSQESELASVTTTGDYTRGTLINSAVLSIFVICIATMVFACVLRKKIKPWVAVVLMPILLIPTMINETKATLVLIPLAFLTVAFFQIGANRSKTIVAAFSVIVLFTLAFIPVYDYFMKPRWGYGIVDFITQENRVENYLSKGAEVGTTGPVGRLDALQLPLKTLSGDPAAMFLGLGLGSVTESVFGEGFTGKYYGIYGELVGPTYSRLLWEIGVFGVLLLSILLFLIFRDSVRLRFEDSMHGVLAHAWVAILPIMVVGMFYKEIMFSPALGIPFWYFSGAIVAFTSQMLLNRKAERIGMRGSARAKENVTGGKDGIIQFDQP